MDRMSVRSSSLPARLRRHRGLWVLAVAVMLIKLASSTLCLVDGIRLQAGTTLPTAASAVLVVAADSASSANKDPCILGEGSNCHCACAHAVTLPATSVVAIAFPALSDMPSLVVSSAGLGAPASLLRPPIT